MPGSDLLLGLVSKIYAAAADTALWPEALADVSQALGSRDFNLFLINQQTGTVPFNVSHGIPEERLAAYNAWMAPRDPRVRHVLANPDLPVVCDYQHIAEQEMDRHPYYEWLAVADFRYYVAVAEPLENGRLACATAQRSASQGHIDRGEADLLLTLKPHLMRALQLSLKLGDLEAQVQAGADAAEALADGLIVLDGRGRVLLMNRETRRIVETGGVLRAGSDGLRAVRVADDLVLQRLIADALGTALGQGATGGGAMRLPRPDSPLGYALQVMPLTGERPLFALDRPAAIVFISDPLRRAATPAARLRVLWGLTEREARLALLLAEGLALKQAADRMGIVVPTARVHLAAIFRKTGARRQADLVRLLTSGVAALAVEMRR